MLSRQNLLCLQMRKFPLFMKINKLDSTSHYNKNETVFIDIEDSRTIFDVYFFIVASQVLSTNISSFIQIIVIAEKKGFYCFPDYSQNVGAGMLRLTFFFHMDYTDNTLLPFAICI